MRCRALAAPVSLSVRSEGILDGQADVVAVADVVVLSAAVELGVLQFAFQAVQVGGLDPQGVGLATFDEVAGLVGVAFEVVLVDHVGRHVDPGEHVVPGAAEQQGVAVGVAVHLVATVAAGNVRAVAAPGVVAGAAVVGGVLQAAAAQVFRGQLGDAGQRVEAQRRAEVVDGPEGGVERLDPLVVVVFKTYTKKCS